MRWIITGLLHWFGTLFFPQKIYRWIYILIKTLPRDLKFLIIGIKFFQGTKQIQSKNLTLPKVFAENVKLHRTKIAYHFEDKSWTFEKVDKFSNQIANYFEQEGFKKGDKIALPLENCVEYSPIWLGLSKKGIIAALINTNLVKDSLLHSIATANCKAVIFGTSHVNAIHDISDKLETRKLYQFRSDLSEELDTNGSVDLIETLAGTSDTLIKSTDISHKDHLLYIYTSGTTGLPKAALVTHVKCLSAVKFFKEIAQSTDKDIVYTPLPLYHSAGGIIGGCHPIINGGTVVIRKRFSATNYFKDCAKYKVTIGQYVGELCRYLLAIPENHSDKYQVKTFIGNGLKPQIWKQFVSRFKVTKIIEIYGATEANIFLANNDGTAGAVGFIPRYLRRVFGTTIIKCDESTGEPIRNGAGLCLECAVGESGILISKLVESSALINYDGYSDKKATEKKLIRNVFRAGDVYFNSGDILEYDELGYFYFKDRTGDTFRWKSENVSSSEVEAIISNILYLSDVVVYGVTIPKNDGRAGMAAIVDAKRLLNIDQLGRDFKQHLPNYAVPVFLRIMDAVPLTGTFKLKKTELREEAYDINRINDKIYFYHSKFEKYVPFTQELYKDLDNGLLKV